MLYMRPGPFLHSYMAIKHRKLGELSCGAHFRTSTICSIFAIPSVGFYLKMCFRCVRSPQAMFTYVLNVDIGQNDDRITIMALSGLHSV